MSAKPKVILFRSAGTNCDLELKYAFEYAGAEVDLVHVRRLISGKAKLSNYQMAGFPGGFSYGDDIASGKVFANEINAHLRSEILEFVREGKPVIGICNGFQILVKAGLLPDPELAPKSKLPDQPATLAINDSNRFECRWVHLRGTSQKCVFFPEDKIIALPVAHGEGKFVVKDPETLEILKKKDQIAFKYVDNLGNIGPYPINPNGSCEDIAGICDPSGRILGLMPHPERHIHPQALPFWTRNRNRLEGDGASLFKNAVNFVKINV